MRLLSEGCGARPAERAQSVLNGHWGALGQQLVDFCIQVAVGGELAA